MAFLYGNIDLENDLYLKASHAPGSNIALAGCFDLPQRTGKTFHEWRDSETIEPYVIASRMFYEGRDIAYHSFLPGLSIPPVLQTINATLKSIAAELNSPYGVFYECHIKSIKSEMFTGGASVVVTFRQRVADLDIGSLPVTGTSGYTIDGIPMSSFGLYLDKPQNAFDLGEFKDAIYTSYGYEFGDIGAIRKRSFLELNGLIVGNNLGGFTGNVQRLAKIFSSIGLRTIKINDEYSVSCFADLGFKVSQVIVSSSGTVAKFRISLRIVSYTIL